MTGWPEYFSTSSVVIAAAAAGVAAVAASGHAILYKRDSRGAMMWVGLIWSLPLIGAGLYFTLGINRIKRRAVHLRRDFEERRPVAGGEPATADASCAVATHLLPLCGVVRKLTGHALLAGNRIDPLAGGEEAFGAMIAAIQGARHSVALCTYIFERDAAGLEFASSLGAAVRRGVEVRVLVDATGTVFSRRPILRALRRNGVRFARFLPALTLGQLLSLNLRNHRKLLVVDGRVGFTGGMNLCADHLRGAAAHAKVEDLHFRVRGPVVTHLQEAFADDWAFTTHESLAGPAWFPALESEGTMPARGIPDGPDEDFEVARWTILAAITLARHSVRIRTPYFLPDNAIISALNLAAMRGVAVEILLPARSDLPMVQWASAAHWWQLLEHGCRIWVSPAPFDHAKTLVVDDAWALVGSANWDPRSLRLNFEFNLECYDAGFAALLNAKFEARRAQAQEATLASMDARSLPVKLRDGMSRLFTPFL